MYDAIVIGAGINGMVAAAELAGAGWKVCLVDSHDRIGGFIANDELTLPGLKHDTWSSWHPLFVTGGAYAALGEDLHRHGLEYCNAEDKVTASVAPDGRVVIAHRDVARTVESFEHPEDRDAYTQMLDALGADMDVIGGLLGMELRGPRSLPVGTGAAGSGVQLFRRGGVKRVEDWARAGLSGGRRWMRRSFRGTEVDQLWAPWLLHAGLTPDSAMGGLMIPLFALTMHGAGLPIVKGGQGAFLDAFESLLAERGVDVRTGATVEEVLVDGHRATGVRLEGGQTLEASRAVLASVSPQALYTRLLPSSATPEATQQEAREYQPGRGAMKIHVALSRPLQWRDERLAGIPLVHLTTGSGSTGVACAQAEAGLLPARPTVAVGQQALIDPSRITGEAGEAGKGMLWLQLQEVPGTPLGDAAGELDTSAGWTEELKTAYVDRVLNLVEEHAPGVRESVEKVVAYSPADLEAYNPNAINGDPYGGCAEIDQFLIWRPGPRTGNHATAVKGLWHIGAATHPGPGLGGGSGHLVAQTLVAAETTRTRRVLDKVLPALSRKRA